MAKMRYEVRYYVTTSNGRSKVGPMTKTIEAESETNVINAMRKLHPDNASRKLEILSIKPK